MQGTPDLKRLVAKTLLVTPSGALSPGPLSAVAVGVGLGLGPLGGFMVALGHMVAELPYVYGLVRFIDRMIAWVDKWRRPLLLLVSAFLVYFGASLIGESVEVYRGYTSSVSGSILSMYEALLAGIALTIFNPYFLAWWATVGYPLVEDSARLGSRGFIVMYASHVWMDYVWLILLAWGGGVARILGAKPYAALLGFLGFVLLAFAGKLLRDAFQQTSK